MAVEFLRCGADVILDDGFCANIAEQVVRMARRRSPGEDSLPEHARDVLRVRTGAQRQPAQYNSPDFARPVLITSWTCTKCRRRMRARNWLSSSSGVGRRIESLGCPWTRVPCVGPSERVYCGGSRRVVPHPSRPIRQNSMKEWWRRTDEETRTLRTPGVGYFLIAVLTGFTTDKSLPLPFSSALSVVRCSFGSSVWPLRSSESPCFWAAVCSTCRT